MQGAFSTVYNAVDSQGVSMVVKEVPISSSQAYQQAISEISILSMLRGSGARVPRLIGYSEATKCAFLILMSREPGMPLDMFMHSRRSLPLRDRIDIANHVLERLVSTLKFLDLTCCHRDLNSHNILIDADSNGLSTVTVVDFGLAVEKNAWWQYRWRDCPIGGDARYWHCSAWRILLEGWRSLSKTPHGEEQYKEKLDMHSMAITLIEILARELSPCASVAEERLRIAFENYWNDVSEFSLIFVKGCRSSGDLADAKIILKKLDVIKRTRDNLSQIKKALKGLRETHFIFNILERMICVDESTVTANWSYVGSKIERSGSHSVRVYY